MCIIEVGQTTRVLVHLTKERDKLLSPLGTVKFAIELYKFNSILFLFSPELTQRLMWGTVKICNRIIQVLLHFIFILIWTDTKGHVRCCKNCNRIIQVLLHFIFSSHELTQRVMWATVITFCSLSSVNLYISIFFETTGHNWNQTW